MRERVRTITVETDERIVGNSRTLKNALILEKNIKRWMRKGVKGGVCLGSASFEISEDSLRFARLVASRAYCELAFKPDKQIDKETGETIRVIDPVGKAIADKIIRDVRKERGIIRYE